MAKQTNETSAGSHYSDFRGEQQQIQPTKLEAKERCTTVDVDKSPANTSEQLKRTLQPSATSSVPFNVTINVDTDKLNTDQKLLQSQQPVMENRHAESNYKKPDATFCSQLQSQQLANRQSFSLGKLPANMSKSKLNEFREAFLLFDKDGDGSITKEELGRVMRSLGQFAREEELQQMLHDVDIDGDGCFSFEEFVEIVSNMGNTAYSTKEEEEKELRDAFRVFDKHNRGYISSSDLRAVLQCLGEDLSEEEIEDMIKEVDVDGDGRIDFYEFVHALGEPGEGDNNDDGADEVEEEEN